MTQFGLEPEILRKIVQVFCKYHTVEKIVIFGSRAKGTERQASDIDLCIVGDVEDSTMLRIDNDLDDLFLPYKFDLVLRKTITHQDLLDHISHFGKVIYTRPSSSLPRKVS